MSSKIENKSIINEHLIYKATEIFFAFADVTRFRILLALSDSDLCVTELVEKCDVSQSAISHQLRLLKDRSLVKSVREGKSIIYSLDDEHVRLLISIGIEHAQHREMRF